MPLEHPPPNEATIKELYGNAIRCALPKCQRPLYKREPGSNTRTLNSRVAHICAGREGGPRWDPKQTPEQNRAGDNLILLCVEHANDIDQPARVAGFPVSLLREWKAQQLAESDATAEGWALSSR